MAWFVLFTTVPAMYQSSFCTYSEKKKVPGQSHNSSEVLAKQFPKYRLLIILWADKASIVHEGIPSHDLLQLLADVLAHDADFHPASTKRDPLNLSVANSRPMVQISRCLCKAKFSTRFRPNEPLPSSPFILLFLSPFLRPCPPRLPIRIFHFAVRRLNYFWLERALCGYLMSKRAFRSLKYPWVESRRPREEFWSMASGSITRQSATKVGWMYANYSLTAH